MNALSSLKLARKTTAGCLLNLQCWKPWDPIEIMTQEVLQRYSAICYPRPGRHLREKKYTVLPCWHWEVGAYNACLRSGFPGERPAAFTALKMRLCLSWALRVWRAARFSYTVLSKQSESCRVKIQPISACFNPRLLEISPSCIRLLVIIHSQGAQSYM